jgi:hypothetical protein
MYPLESVCIIALNVHFHKLVDRFDEMLHVCYIKAGSL